MSKKKKEFTEHSEGIFSEKQIKELEKMAKEMTEMAANIVDEYEDLDLSDLSELSGSITQIHEDSPYLSDLLKGESWKKVIKNIPPIPKDIKEDDTE